MVINNDTSTISFFPFISFEGIFIADVEVIHKNTKVKATSESPVAMTGTMVALEMPVLTDIDLVAKNLDTCLIRVYSNNVLIWEYLATWSNESTSNLAIFKDFQTTEPSTNRWVTL